VSKAGAPLPWRFLGRSSSPRHGLLLRGSPCGRCGPARASPGLPISTIGVSILLETSRTRFRVRNHLFGPLRGDQFHDRRYGLPRQVVILLISLLLMRGSLSGCRARAREGAARHRGESGDGGTARWTRTDDHATVVIASRWEGRRGPVGMRSLHQHQIGLPWDQGLAIIIFAGWGASTAPWPGPDPRLSETFVVATALGYRDAIAFVAIIVISSSSRRAVRAAPPRRSVTDGVAEPVPLQCVVRSDQRHLGVSITSPFHRTALAGNAGFMSIGRTPPPFSTQHQVRSPRDPAEPLAAAAGPGRIPSFAFGVYSPSPRSDSRGLRAVLINGIADRRGRDRGDPADGARDLVLARDRDLPESLGLQSNQFISLTCSDLPRHPRDGRLLPRLSVPVSPRVRATG